MHVTRLQECIKELKSQEELVPQLQQFTSFINDSEVPDCKVPSIKKIPTVLPIPYDLPPNLRECLRQDHSRRFNMYDGVANLIPAATSTCSQCGAHNSWTTPCIDENTFLVTPLYCYQAKGLCNNFGFGVTTHPRYYTFAIIILLHFDGVGLSYIVLLSMPVALMHLIIVYLRNCTTDGCLSQLRYDGQKDCILNMGLFLIAYEVLRNHMYHFFSWKVKLQLLL